MRALNGYNEAKASTGEYEKIPAGGYVCQILKVEDVYAKEYLKITFDVYEGEWRGYYREQRERLQNSGYSADYVGTFIRSYKDSAIGFFKGLVTAIDESNGTNFGPCIEAGFDEQRLVGCLVGLVIGYEEYEKKKGGIGERETVVSQRSIQKIRSGDFKVPDLKRISAGAKSSQLHSATPATDDFSLISAGDADLPF